MSLLFSRLKRAAGAVAIAAIGLGATAASAQDVTTLRLSTHHPSNSPEIEKIINPMKEFIETKSGGKLKVEVYPNAMLNSPKDAFKALSTDIADIAPTYPVYQARSFSLNHVSSLPQAFPNTYVGFRVNEELYADFYKPEWDKIGVYPLFYAVTDTYDLITTKPIKSIDDLKGMKIRSAGGIMDEVVKALGASAVSIPISEAYTAFQQGVVDGIFQGASNMITFRLNEVGKYYVPLAITRTAIPWSVNPETFKKLSPDMQQVVFDAAREATINYADRYTNAVEQAQKELKESGVQTIELSKEDHDKIQAAINPLWDKFIEENGDQGKALVEALRSKVAAYGDMDRDTFVRLQREEPVKGMMPPQK
ncbi:MAG: TRAP transporter substrate-binding protein DctP [Rhodobiaceae bacterium]|nr:TRAP transporter substrate-binding protein DctP [Rhodobiaceae bacterium]MCC0055339.1 TRAP transporter substrate-binding protein DctP [Rhodobiaceae bacterium]